MDGKKKNFKKKFPEVAEVQYLTKLQKEILKDLQNIEKFEFNLESVLEVKTPLIQFLISVKKYAQTKSIDFEIKNIPFSGKEVLELYGLTI